MSGNRLSLTAITDDLVADLDEDAVAVVPVQDVRLGQIVSGSWIQAKSLTQGDEVASHGIVQAEVEIVADEQIDISGHVVVGPGGPAAGPCGQRGTAAAQVPSRRPAAPPTGPRGPLVCSETISRAWRNAAPSSWTRTRRATSAAWSASWALLSFCVAASVTVRIDSPKGFLPYVGREDPTLEPIQV